MNLLSEKEIYDLEMTFRELDKDGDGMITAEEAQLVYTRWLKNLLVVSEGILPRFVLVIYRGIYQETFLNIFSIWTHSRVVRASTLGSKDSEFDSSVVKIASHC